MRFIPVLASLFLATGGVAAQADTITPLGQWTVEKAKAWHAKQPWFAGCNFVPSTAINQLEMWQEETWDPATIDRELGWAADLGFNSVRVYLHDIPWSQDPDGFLERIDKFLAIANSHGIGAMLVLFDGVWNPFPKAGPQPDPTPRVHNSGWVQNPGAEILGNPDRHDEMKGYVQAVIGRFRDDPRVQIWDIFNEPNNPVPQYADVELPNKAEMALALLEKAYGWAREVNPTQPITSGVWIGEWADPEKLSPMERFQLEESDVISFHSYQNIDQVRRCVTNLQRYDRPIFCTEYMARPLQSRFDPILGYLSDEKVGAYNWGFVDGKSQTIYPWDSWKREYTAEPDPWFHDILRRDGTPYDPAETRYIQSVTGATKIKP